MTEDQAIAEPPLATLETTALYIDASVRYALNFNWDGPVLAALRRLCEAGSLELKETSIGVREMSGHIREKAQIAQQALDKARKLSSILNQLPGHPDPAFAPFDLGAVVAQLEANAAEYFTACGAESIDIDGVTVSQLMEGYFGRVAPFGEGKKKAEFPDAAVVLALRAWCAANDRKVYVVSEDPDMESACDPDGPLLHAPSLEALISAATAQLELVEAIEAALRDREDEILQKIAPDWGYLGFVLDDSDGDVNHVEATDVDVGRAYVLSRDDNSFEIEIEATVSFTAQVSYDDLSTAMWDSEDKVLYAWNTIERELERETSVRIQLDCTIDIEQVGDMEIERAAVTEPVDVYFSVEEPEDHWR